MKFGFIILQDVISNGEAVGTVGPRGANDDVVTRLRAGFGHEFRMRDDDGALYYVGRYIGPSDECMFAPLDCFGMPNAGCTSIEYQNPATKIFEAL